MSKEKEEVLNEVSEIIKLFFDNVHFYKYCIIHAERMVMEACDTPTMMFRNEVLIELNKK